MAAAKPPGRPPATRQPGTFGYYTAQLRERRGWSVSDLADRLDISLGYMSQLERGKNYPSEELVDRLVRLFRVREPMRAIILGFAYDPVYNAYRKHKVDEPSRRFMVLLRTHLATEKPLSRPLLRRLMTQAGL